MWNLEIPEEEDPKTEDTTRQLSITNEVVGECSNCDSKVVKEDRFEDSTDLFECQKCEKVNNFS